MIKRSNKTQANTGHLILVSEGDQALPTGALATATTALNLANRQLGVLSYDANSSVRPLGQFLVSGDDSAEVQAIRVVMGTPKSAATQTVSLWEDGDLAYQQSDTIKRGQILSVSVKKPTYGKLGGQVLSSVPVPANDLLYGLYLTLSSTRTDKAYGINNDVTYASAPIKNFTTASIAQPKDYVLQYLANQLNSESKVVLRNGFNGKGAKDFVVFGVKIAGGSGQALGTITPTTSITFDVRNGVNQVMQLGNAGVVALADLVNADANLTATSTIEVLNVLTAGTAATIDALIILGLEHDLASAYDDQAQRMVSPSINLTDNWRAGATQPVVTTANAEESVNTGRLWFNEWRNRPGLMVHTRQIQPMGDWFNEGKSYINEAKLYTSYIVDYWDNEQTLTHNQVGQKRLVLLFPAEKLAAFTTNVSNVVTRIAAGNSPITIVTSNDAGTGTASANVVAGVEAVLSAWLEHSRTTAGSFTVTGDAVAGGVYLS